MIGRDFSLILLPTLTCNAACEYCFVDRRGKTLSEEGLAHLARKVGQFVRDASLAQLTLHWQGGEVMTLSPDWFRRAREILDRETRETAVQIHHSLQSNMMAYDAKWGELIKEMFSGSVGTSFDYPNRHRMMEGGLPEEYNERWIDRIHAAWDDGISTGVICLPNAETLKLGAEAFYSYLVDEIGLTDFQVNTPFSGGSLNTVRSDFPLDPGQLGDFLADLARIWLEKDEFGSIRVGPFAEFLARFENEQAAIPCLWHRNCADGFLCVDPDGNVAQCDCWVASYQAHRYGNIFHDSFGEILRNSRTRQEFLNRPATILERADCADCPYLSICHGGCPIRAFTCAGDLMAKDPYCEAYKRMFKFLESAATRDASAT